MIGTSWSSDWVRVFKSNKRDLTLHYILKLLLMSKHLWDVLSLSFFVGDMNGEFLTRFCGQSPPRNPIVVSTPELWVQFVSDEDVGDLGFKATYYYSGTVVQSVTL